MTDRTQRHKVTDGSVWPGRLLEGIAALEALRKAGGLHTEGEILAAADPEHFGPEAKKLAHGYFGYRKNVEVTDSVTQLQGNGQNARPFMEDLGVYSDGKPTWIRVEAHCDRCDAVIIGWRNFSASIPHRDIIGLCNSYPEHVSRNRHWRYMIIEIMQVEKFDP